MVAYRLSFSAVHDGITELSFSSRDDMKEWLEKYPSVYDFDWKNITINVATPEISPYEVAHDVDENPMDVFDMVEKLKQITATVENETVTDDTLNDLLSLINPLAKKLEEKYKNTRVPK